MRGEADSAKVEQLLTEFGRAAPGTRIYLVGGATAVLEGWRATTVDVDLEIEPDTDEMLRRIPGIKEKVDVNIKLAKPSEFIPELPGWRERSRFRLRTGNVEVFDYDYYDQALAKIERGFETDTDDVESMISAGLIKKDLLLDLFNRIESELFRYPAIDPAAFREKVERVAA